MTSFGLFVIAIVGNGCKRRYEHVQGKSKIGKVSKKRRGEKLGHPGATREPWPGARVISAGGGVKTQHAQPWKPGFSGSP